MPNTAETRRLYDKKYQALIVDGIIEGINNYVAGGSMTADNLPE